VCSPRHLNYKKNKRVKKGTFSIMATMGPYEYARKYWEMEVPIINDDNEIVRYEKVDFNKYRLHLGWSQNIFPPGHKEFVSAVNTYANGLFKKGKRLELRVKTIWGNIHYLSPESYNDLVYQRVLWRSVLAFSGKGSPEDVQLTLQLAARCGVAKKGLQQYCDEKVDTYSRLGLDCNGFVGNYLCYRDSANAWNPFGLKPPTFKIHGETGIRDMVTQLGTQPVKNVDDMFTPRIHVLGMVDSTGTVINQFDSNGGVGHVMITEATCWGKREVWPPIPKEYLNGRYMWYSGVEATPAVGLSPVMYAILKITNNGVATVWREKVKSLLNVKIYPVN
jgi:hypothetical protein